jgi:anti-sigma factor RsiW
MAQQTTKPKRLTKETCKQISALVLAYLNDELSPHRKREFQQHLKICPDCVNFLKTYKKTIQATGTLSLDEMPSKVRDNIWQFLRRKLRA